MSKLAGIRAYQTSGYYAGDLAGLFSKVVGGAKKLLGKGKSLVSGASGLISGKSGAGMEQIAQMLGLTPGGKAPGGGGGGTGVRRRSRGITARELRGYRKVANLLHKEGMVSRRGRGRR